MLIKIIHHQYKYNNPSSLNSQKIRLNVMRFNSVMFEFNYLINRFIFKNAFFVFFLIFVDFVNFVYI